MTFSYLLLINLCFIQFLKALGRDSLSWCLNILICLISVRFPLYHSHELILLIFFI
jgi:hypothetical protein